MLEGYDVHERQYLVRGFTTGFHIPYEAFSVVQSDNMPSVTRYSIEIDSYINSELEKGRIQGPFVEPPFRDFHVSPICMIPKKESGKYRMIHNLSFPQDHSLNDYIPDHEATVQYETLNTVLQQILKYGQGSFLAKADVESAFRIIPIHPDSHHLLGFKWNNKFYYDKCLPMGCRISCRLFERFTCAIQWILKTKFLIPTMSHILDDFIFVSDNQSSCQKYLNTFMALATQINLPIKHSKTVLPSTIVVVHGVEVDTIKMETRLPQDKVVKAKNQLQFLYKSRKVTLRSLQSVLGFLNFACQVIVPGRSFLQRLFVLTKGLTKPHHHLRINSEARADLTAWLHFVQAYNGRTMLQEHRWLSSDTMSLYTDSASTCGYAAVFKKAWFNGAWPISWKNMSIAFLELFPIVIALEYWSNLLENKCIIFHSDNKAVVDIINAQSSNNPPIMFLIRRLVLSCMNFNILFIATHIPGKYNITADLLSRFQEQQAMLMAPWLNSEKEELPAHLHPENIQLKRSWLHHSPKAARKPILDPSTQSIRT